MKYNPPKIVELTEKESNIYKSIHDQTKTAEEWKIMADKMEWLKKSLLKRKAIPEIRLRIFADPKYAETGKKSIKQIFESNETTGNEIFRHPHFIKYLSYFIEGPDLPKEAIQGFCQILNDDFGTSGMILSSLRKYVRLCVRKFSLDRAYAASQFFRLSKELNIEYDAHCIRNAAISTR